MVLATYPDAVPVAASELKAILATLAGRQEQYRQATAYYDGQHNLVFATTKFRQAFGSLFAAFADNLCASVVDAAADRLQITGFDQEGKTEPQEGQPKRVTVADAAWALWQQAKLPRLAGQVHQEALTAGDAYLVVWPDASGQPVFFPQCASSMTVTYDPDQPGLITRAAKWWRLEDGRGRLTLYYPDRIEKYVTRTKTHGGLPDNPRNFVPFDVPGEAWPLLNEYGQVPVFHFGNNAPIGGFGRSELRDVIPLQNALNKSVADMLVAMEFQALPQRWATGIEVEVDPDTGKVKPPFETGPDRIWAVGAEAAKFGQFEPASLTQFLEAQEKFRLEIARVSRTPMHYLLMTGNWPSGEAIKTAEEPFVRKVKDRQMCFGDVWEGVLSFALRIQGVKGADAAVLEALWEDATPRPEKEHLEGLQIKQGLGVSQKQLWREMDYSADQIGTMLDDKASVDILLEVGQGQ